jgi:hypothetical protein
MMGKIGSYRLGDHVAWTENGDALEGVVEAFTSGTKRQVLTVRMANGAVTVIRVDLAEGQIIDRSLDLVEARQLALTHLQTGRIQGLSETSLVNLLAHAVVALTAERGRA